MTTPTTPDLDEAADTLLEDPFAGIEDETEPSPADSLSELLARARRGYVTVRSIFVQRPTDAPDPGDGRPSPRASVLWELVRGRQELALDLLLLLHALQPILVDRPLPVRVYARLLTAISRSGKVSTAAVSRALSTLERHQLLTRRRGPGEADPTITLLREDGSGDPWTRPGSSATGGEEERYFVIPFSYWTENDASRLSLPGKAMLLVILKETQDPAGPKAFSMAVERARRYYGFSERTAERGYTELKKAGLTTEKVQKIIDGRHPAGRRAIHWRALEPPYSTQSRERLQKLARTAATKSP